MASLPDLTMEDGYNLHDLRSVTGISLSNSRFARCILGPVYLRAPPCPMLGRDAWQMRPRGPEPQGPRLGSGPHLYTKGEYTVASRVVIPEIYHEGLGTQARARAESDHDAGTASQSLSSVLVLRRGGSAPWGRTGVGRRAAAWTSR